MTRKRIRLALTLVCAISFVAVGLMLMSEHKVMGAIVWTLLGLTEAVSFGVEVAS